MKLFSEVLELRAIKTICSGSKDSAYLLGKLHESMFHTEVGLSSFVRISTLIKDGGKLPSFKMLAEDPVLKGSLRDQIRKFGKRQLDFGDYEKAIKHLSDYRATRKMLHVFEHTMEQLNGDGADIEDLLNNVADELGKIRSGSDSTKVWSFGVDGNADSLVDDIIEGKSERLIPTTFDAWDSVNGGIPETACVIMAAPSGHGKSQMGASLAKNLAERGFKSGIIPLEMSPQQLTSRMISAITEIPVNKVLQADKLTDNEKSLIRKRYKKWQSKIVSEGGSYKIFEMGYTPNIQQALYTALPYDLDILVIDYVALLDGMDGDNDWRALSEAVRAGKRFAMQHKIPVVFLAQLGNDMQLRYSKRMLDDADIAWIWTAKDKDPEGSIIGVETPKARNMMPMNFELFVKWQYTNIVDLDEDTKRQRQLERDNNDKGMQQKKGSFKRKGNGSFSLDHDIGKAADDIADDKDAKKLYGKPSRKGDDIDDIDDEITDDRPKYMKGKKNKDGTTQLSKAELKEFELQNIGYTDEEVARRLEKWKQKQRKKIKAEEADKKAKAKADSKQKSKDKSSKSDSKNKTGSKSKPNKDKSDKKPTKSDSSKSKVAKPKAKNKKGKSS